MDDIKKILISLFIVLMIFPAYTHAAKGALTDEAKVCLTCHASRGINKILENKEILSLYIKKDEFVNSVHNDIGCGSCHTGYMAAHVQKKKQIKSKKQYTVNASKVCSMCHPNDQLKKIPIHTSLMTKAACVECHGSHYIKSLAEWKKGINEIQYCLTCHRLELSMPLKSSELLALSINESAYKSSKHGDLLCSSCHKVFSNTKHPVRTFRDKKEYTALATKSCSMCHLDKQLRKSPVHSSLMAKTACVECHGSHAIRGIKVQKAVAKESQYCLMCHKSRLSMTMKNGEALSVYVDESLIGNSVHRKLQCIDCHSDFSKSKHPTRVFKSTRNYSIVTSDLCSKCHPEAYAKWENSIHFTRLKSGDLKAAACTDCHSGHSVVKAITDKTVGLTSCNKCHGELNSSYEASVHNKARIKGKAGAPVCSSCHNAHNIESTKMTTRIKEGCFKCHKDMGSVHNRWLKNPPVTLATFAKAHFDVVSCAVCHSPNAKRGIYLSLFDSKTGKPLTEEEVIKLLDTDAAGLREKLDTNSDGLIEGKELWNIFRLLLKKDVRTTFMGKMDVSNTAEAHRLGTKKEAVRECGECHHPKSEYFKNVFIVISKTGGGTTVLPAKKDLVNSIFSIIPVRKFYAIGGTNISLFDILFYAALIGGLAVPIGHITLRTITSPLRALRRMGKGGKK